MSDIISVKKGGVEVTKVKDHPKKETKDKQFFYKQAKKKMPKEEKRVKGLRKK